MFFFHFINKVWITDSNIFFIHLNKLKYLSYLLVLLFNFSNFRFIKWRDKCDNKIFINYIIYIINDYYYFKILTARISTKIQRKNFPFQKYTLRKKYVIIVGGSPSFVLSTVNAEAFITMHAHACVPFSFSR